MTPLPNPFICDSMPVPESSSRGGMAAVDAFPSSPRLEASTANLLAEIESHHRFRLDVRAFMEAIEPMPIFLGRG